MKSPKTNRLLDAFPDTARKKIAGSLKKVSLTPGQTLHEPAQKIRKIYFPLTAVVSVVTRMLNGETVESATVGEEGLVGLPVFLTSRATVEAFVQIPGEALEMAGEELLRMSREDSGVERLLSAYTALFIRFMSQSSACNRVHDTRERCARWLLMADNRTEGDTFPLTQQFLGEMIGVRRASVTAVMGAFRRDRLVSYRRGVIRILDRERLEQTSCECYGTLRDAFEELLGR